MKKNLLLLILFSTISVFSQDYELRVTPTIKSKIIYKDGTSVKGMLWLANSAFKLRLKTEGKGRDKKIDYKIITNPETENERTFQYLNHNYNKFKIFVKLIYNDVLSIYIGSNDSDDLFYSDFDRQSIREKIQQMKFEGNNYF